ncbi:MAG: hypothetical protein LN413_00545 [Candidatus Thermoplasmatota archaeon]|nr:hypothetical protein [Candidatus Thermoplasmatota archaeon]
MARAKTVTLGQLEAKKSRIREQVRKAEERESALKARLRKLEVQYDEAYSSMWTKRNDLAGYNGIISMMAKYGAAGYVSKDGAIEEWVMPDGSRKDATVEVD